MPRVVGVDFGLKRVGIALADPLRMFASAYGSFNQAAALAALCELHEREGLETIVIGWPLTPEGDEGPTSNRVDAYVKRIQRALPNVDVVRWDERYTSIEARELLVRAGVPRKGRREKGRLDAAAAAVILQQYLESGSGT